MDVTPTPTVACTMSLLMIAGDQSTPETISMQNAYLIIKTHKIPVLKT
jgi:hypothetical protein